MSCETQLRSRWSPWNSMTSCHCWYRSNNRQCNNIPFRSRRYTFPGISHKTSCSSRYQLYKTGAPRGVARYRTSRTQDSARREAELTTGLPKERRRVAARL
jgi:UDP:flavonoid glycosyltransferase YjiC (YdhE family)